VINRGIWHDACRGLDRETHYYFLSLETDEPAVFQPLDGGAVTVVL
jgi:ureidoglycolate lyase